MEKKLKTLLTYSNNASWFTLRHVLVINHIFENYKDDGCLYSHEVIKKVGLDQSTANRIFQSLANISVRQNAVLWITYEMCIEDLRYREIGLTPLGKVVRQHYLGA